MNLGATSLSTIAQMVLGGAGVTLAGDYMDAEYPPTLEAAVRSGVRAAAAIL